MGELPGDGGAVHCGGTGAAAGVEGGKVTAGKVQTSAKTREWMRREREEAELSPETRALLGPLARRMDLNEAIERAAAESRAAGPTDAEFALAHVRVARQMLHEARVRRQAKAARG